MGKPPRSSAFLLAQIGSHAAGRFAERLRDVNLQPHHAGILRAVTANAGISQQSLAGMLGMVPSRLVTLLDELEERGLVERRNHPDDRRLYALHLTTAGEKALGEVAKVGRAHEEEITASLSAAEREKLGELLARIAEAQGLTPGVHPGFSRMR